MVSQRPVVCHMPYVHIGGMPASISKFLSGENRIFNLNSSIIIYLFDYIYLIIFFNYILYAKLLVHH